MRAEPILIPLLKGDLWGSIWDKHWDLVLYLLWKKWPKTIKIAKSNALDCMYILVIIVDLDNFYDKT